MSGKNESDHDNSGDGGDVATALNAEGSHSTPIPVYRLVQGSGIPVNAIWDPESAMQLRRLHALTGDLSGTMPKHPSQNQHLTIPLLLSEEEITYGVSNGTVSVFAETPSSYAPPDETAVQAFYEERDAYVESHVEESVQHQRDERAKRREDTLPISRKRTLREMEAGQKHDQNPFLNTSSESAACPKHGDENRSPPVKKQRAGFLNAFTSSLRHLLYTLTGTLCFPPPNPEVPPRVGEGLVDRTDCDLVLAEKNTTPTTNSNPSTEVEDPLLVENARREVLETKMRKQASTTVLIEAATAARDDENAKYLEVNPAPAGMLSPRARARQAVFNDLRKRGYSMTCGAKFGADFLAYATDPLLVHASLAVVVIDGDEDISTHDVIALGRLGDATRKRTVLAWSDDPSEGLDVSHVNYVGIQWEETLP